MDPLSMTASITAVLQITGTIISYIKDVREASKEQTVLGMEVSELKSLLTVLQTRVRDADSGEPWFAAVRTLGAKDGPLDQFKFALEQLASKLGQVNGLKRVAKTLIWPFDKTEIKGMLDAIERLKSLVGLALGNDLL